MPGNVMVSSVLRKPGDCVFEFIDKVRAMMALSPPGSCHGVKTEEQRCSSHHPLWQLDRQNSEVLSWDVVPVGVASLCKNTPSNSQVVALEVALTKKGHLCLTFPGRANSRLAFSGPGTLSVLCFSTPKYFLSSACP